MLWEPEHRGAQVSASKLGVHIYWNASTREDDIDGQIALVERVTSGNYRGLVLAPDHSLALITPVRRALASGLSTVIVGSPLPIPPDENLSYILNDEEEGGRLAAQRVAELIRGRGLIAIIGINPDIAGIIERANSLETFLTKNYPQIRVVVRRVGTFNVPHEQQGAEELLKGSPGLNVIVALTSTSTHGAISAVEASARNRGIKVIGFDPDSLLFDSPALDSVVLQCSAVHPQEKCSIPHPILENHGRNPRQVLALIRPLMKRRSSAITCSSVALLLFFCTGIMLSQTQQRASGKTEVIGELQKGNNQGALSLATRALRQTPHDCGLLALKAVALTNLGQLQPALDAFHTSLIHCPAYLPALEGAAQLDYSQRAPETVPLLGRILALDPGNLTAHAMLASILRTENRCDEALPHFYASKAFFPSRPDLLEGYGSCLAKTGDLKAALTQYLQLLASKPNDTIRYDTALLQWKTHADDDALATLTPLLAGAQNEAALSLASSIYEAKGDTPRAVELLRSAILLAPDRTDNYLDFADIAFTHKSFQVGIDMVNAGLKRLPGSAPLYVARGVLQVQISHTVDAIADFEQAHRLDPTLSFAVDAMGIMQSQQHQSAQSLALFQSQVKLRPDDPLLQYLLAEQLSEDTAGAGSANLAAAITAAKQATTLDPKYKAAHDLLAVLYIRAEQPAQAIEQAELALAQDPDDQGALYQEILATRRSGQTNRVNALVARLKEIRKENEQKQQDVDRYRLQDEATP